MDKEKESPKIRIPTMEEDKEFDAIDNRLDKVIEKSVSNITLKKKIFMKISDVDEEDAAWFKKFCDTHVDKKQFLGMKVIRTVMEKLGPLVENVLVQINNLTKRIDEIEATISEPITEEKEKLDIPQGQGSKKSKYKKEN